MSLSKAEEDKVNALLASYNTLDTTVPELDADQEAKLAALLGFDTPSTNSTTTAPISDFDPWGDIEVVEDKSASQTNEIVRNLEAENQRLTNELTASKEATETIRQLHVEQEAQAKGLHKALENLALSKVLPLDALGCRNRPHSTASTKSFFGICRIAGRHHAGSR
jgi:hypothetical protein